MSENAEIVVLLSLKSQTGRSVFDADTAVTRDNVSNFHADEARITDLCNKAKELGFKVHCDSQLAISIVGPRALFENTFQIGLRSDKRTILGNQDIAFFSADGHKDIPIPNMLSDLVHGVILPVPPVYFAEPSALPPISNDNTYRYLNVPDDISMLFEATKVHRFGITGRGIKVAMPDSGFYRHPFYSSHGYRVREELLAPGASELGEDSVGHGTGEAANIFAIAPDIELIPVKMSIDSVGAFSKAISVNPHVITCSWGYDVDNMAWPDLMKKDINMYKQLKLLESVIADAVAKGIVVCFSAGNVGKKGFPGSHPDVISVGGVHVNYPFYSSDDFQASNYASSFDSSLYPGRHVPDVCGLVGKNVQGNAPLIMLPVQPGSNLDLQNTGSIIDGWGIFSGTSAACPQVAGTIALLLQKEKLPPNEVKEKLISTATDIHGGKSATGESASEGTDNATGYGLVNAKRAWFSIFEG